MEYTERDLPLSLNEAEVVVLSDGTQAAVRATCSSMMNGARVRNSSPVRSTCLRPLQATTFSRPESPRWRSSGHNLRTRAEGTQVDAVHGGFWRGDGACRRTCRPACFWRGTAGYPVHMAVCQP